MIERLGAALSGRYTLERELGAGGMATVYLADDVKHGRRVAIKVLRPELAAVIGGERFLAEIKTTAALQHPHILPLFDSGEADGFLYYVMPYVEGESLRALLDRERQLDVSEAVGLAKAVASALEYAHGHDVIHRDIKPENILIHAGQPVVADFGIALAISAAGGGRLTETGLSLGTPHYMSPEQASADRDLSPRSDVYSLGCVLYEMLAGQPPHTGPTAQSILVRILTEDPRSLTDLRRTVPPHVTAAVTKAIEKLPADRFRTAQEFSAALDDPSFRWEPARAAPTATTGVRTGAAPAGAMASPGAWDARSRAFAGAAVLFAAVAAWLALERPAAPTVDARAPVVSFVLMDSANQVGLPFAGPDGTLAYGDGTVGGPLLVRSPGALEATPLEGTAGVSAAAFSPDGTWVAFTAGGPSQTLKKVPARGGPVVTLWAPAGTTQVLQPPDWGHDGWIYLGVIDGTSVRLVRVPDVGGPPETVHELPSGRAIFDAQRLPEGDGVVFTAFTGAGTAGHVVALDLSSGDTATVVPDGFSPRWSPTGHLVYAHASAALFAVPFDPRSLRPTGPPVPVRDGVGIFAAAAGRYDLSATGTLTYVSAPPTGGSSELTFLWVSSQGQVDALPLEPTDHWDAEISPDGRELAYIRSDQVWIYDLDLGRNRPLTTEGTDHHNPRWSPDGSQLAFRGTRASVQGIWVQDRSGATPARLVSEGIGHNPATWLPDGTLLVSADAGDILLAHTDGSTPIRGLLEADWIEQAPAVSPDRRWIAYRSSRGGALAVYVRSWPDLAGESLVSDGGVVAGNGYPVWSPDGSTLYYDDDGAVQAVRLEADGAGVRVVSRRTISVTAPGFILQDVGPDGRLFGLASGEVTEDGEGVVARLIVVTNWFTELRGRLAGVGS